MTTYRVDGFNRQKTEERVTVLLDRKDETDLAELTRRAEAIAGPAYCFHMSQNLLVPVPDDCKGVIFKSDEELYARVPQLDHRRSRPRSRTRKP